MKEVKLYGLKDFSWERWRDLAGHIDVKAAAMHLLAEGSVRIIDDDGDEVAMSNFSNPDIAINYIESVTNLQTIRSRQLAGHIIVTAFFFEVYV